MSSELIDIKKPEFIIPDIFSGLTEEQIKEYESRVIEQERKQEHEQRTMAFRGCGIGELYWSCDLHNFSTEYPMQKTMLNTAREFYSKVTKGIPSNLAIFGGAGEGKTTLAVGLLKQFTFTVKSNEFGLKQYYSICYITSKDLCDMLQKTQSFSYGKSWDKILNDFSFYDVLVIDEAGKATVKNEWDCLFSVFDKRMQYRKSSIIVGNLTYDEFNANMSDYGMSRLNIGGNLLQLNVEGIPDLRQKSIDKVNY